MEVLLGAASGSGDGGSRRGPVPSRTVRENVRIVRDLSRRLTLSYAHLGGAPSVAGSDECADEDAEGALNDAAEVLLRVKAVLAGLVMEREMARGVAGDDTADAGVMQEVPDGEEEDDEVGPDDSASNGPPVDAPRGGGAARSGRGEGPPPPLAAYCSITGDVFRDPVITRYGHSYERDALKRALEEDAASQRLSDWKSGDARDPITRRPLRWPGDIVTNRALREVCSEMGWSVPPE